MKTKNIVDKAVEYINANKTWNVIEEEFACERMDKWRCGIAQADERIADGIQDLLEEFGEDNGLPECWWLEEGDLDDWFFLSC